MASAILTIGGAKIAALADRALPGELYDGGGEQIDRLLHSSDNSSDQACWITALARVVGPQVQCCQRGAHTGPGAFEKRGHAFGVK